MSKFVKPETRTLTLSDGDTLIVKKRLNQGEKRAHHARLYVPGPDGKLRVNAMMAGLSTVLAYLLDWSLRDDSGAPIPIKGLAIDQLTLVLDGLDPDDYAEIQTAITDHEEAMQAERDEAKKARGGELKSAATSPSQPAADGPSITSAA